MDINAIIVKEHRTKNNWTQQHLADACGLSLRTIQRVERYGNASQDTVGALAAVFEIDAETILVPEIKVESYEREKMPVWVSQLSIAVSSGLIGYIIAMLTR